MDKRHQFVIGFAIHESLEPHVIEFNPMSGRIAVLRLNITN